MKQPMDREAVDETAYLLRSPANAKRLIESLAQAEAGMVKERELIELINPVRTRAKATSRSRAKARSKLK